MILLDTCNPQLHLGPSLSINNFDIKRESDPVGGVQLEPGRVGLGIGKFQTLTEIVSTLQHLTLPMLHTFAALTASVPPPGVLPQCFWKHPVLGLFCFQPPAGNT